MVLQYMPPMENMLLPIQEPFRLFQAFWILLGLYMLKYLYLMLYYEYRYKLGEQFIDYGEECVKKMVSTRNIGIKR